MSDQETYCSTLLISVYWSIKELNSEAREDEHARAVRRRLMSRMGRLRQAGFMLRVRHLMVLFALAVSTALPAAPTAADIPPQNATLLTVTRPGDTEPTYTFQQSQEVQWFKIALKQGQDYSLRSSFQSASFIDYRPTITVYNSSGKKLLTFQMTEANSGFFAGREFRAPATSNFYIKAANTGPSFPLTYTLVVERDCRAGTTTKCWLAAGQERSGHFGFTDDRDWYRISAQAGKKYTVTLEVNISGRLLVRNRRGKVIGTCFAECAIVKFKAAYTGPYYAETFQEDEASDYFDLSLTSP